MRIIVFSCFLVILLYLPSCKHNPPMAKVATAESHAPAWAKDAIWYQILVERFKSGSESNNPTRESLIGAWPDSIPSDWSVTPWTQDWYKPDSWFKNCIDPDNFYHGVQARRYGGDLIGVKEKINYLAELGINAIYFNPLNDAPSLHKYDPTHYRHIDRYFGPAPEEDTEIIAKENPADPNTWQWTTADRLFLDIIKACHDRGIRVILDYSWNHTGRNFWAFNDVKKKGEQSDFKDWYYINSFDDPKTDSFEFSYQAWFGAMTLPELKEDLKTPHAQDGSVHLIEGDIYDPTLKQHIFSVTERWMDPNGDGDPSDGVDGYRLDVAAEIPMGFWRAYRKHVKTINPEAILIGEIWWELWPDKLLDPKPFLGEAFDAVMNYRWYRESRRLFAQAGEKIIVNQFVDRIDSINGAIDSTYRYAMMNLLGSHDSPRVLSSIYNKESNYKMGKPHEDENYNVNKPDSSVYDVLESMLVHQYTYIGAPHIWNGDEMGMWGADDPDCRKPLIWPDYTFENETHHPVKNKKAPSSVSFNTEIFDLYKDAIAMRKKYPVLRDGSFNFLPVEKLPNVLVYERRNASNHAVIILNLDKDLKEVFLPLRVKELYQNVWRSNNKTIHLDQKITLKPRECQVWINTK